MDADVVVVGAGLAGLVATCELAEAGRSVVLLDQESEANLGGQAWWSFGGLFLVDSPEQRRMGISDSFDLAWQDWQGTAGWDRLVAEDGTPGPTTGGRSGAGPTSSGPPARSGRGCARGGSPSSPSSAGPSAVTAPRGGHGNSVPRFHIPWGTGTGVVAPFDERVLEHIAAGRVFYKARHRVDELVTYRRGRHRGARVGAGAPTPRCAASRATGPSSATSSTAARPSSSPRAASAGTTTSSARTGLRDWATRPPTCSPVSRPTSTAG